MISLAREKNHDAAGDESSTRSRTKIKIISQKKRNEISEIKRKHISDWLVKDVFSVLLSEISCSTSSHRCYLCAHLIEEVLDNLIQGQGVFEHDAGIVHEHHVRLHAASNFAQLNHFTCMGRRELVQEEEIQRRRDTKKRR